MISGHAAVSSRTLFAGPASADPSFAAGIFSEELESPHARLLARGGVDTAISRRRRFPLDLDPPPLQTARKRGLLRLT